MNAKNHMLFERLWPILYKSKWTKNETNKQIESGKFNFKHLQKLCTKWSRAWSTRCAKCSANNTKIYLSTSSTAWLFECLIERNLKVAHYKQPCNVVSSALSLSLSSSIFCFLRQWLFNTVAAEQISRNKNHLNKHQMMRYFWTIKNNAIKPTKAITTRPSEGNTKRSEKTTNYGREVWCKRFCKRVQVRNAFKISN